MSLRGRVSRLEGRTVLRQRSDERCPACGVAPADAVVYACEPPQVIGERAGEDDGGPDVCPGCGRVLVYRCAAPRELAPAP